MKIKKKGIKIINRFLFILIYAIKSITDAIYISKGIESNIWVNSKYAILIISIAFCLFQLKDNKDKKIFTKELKNILFLFFSFFLISLLCAIISNTFYTKTIGDLIKLIIPVIYVFCILNVFDFDDIYVSMIGVLLFSIYGYILEVGFNKFSIENLLKMSFSSSYSPFESHYFSGVSIAMCVFFMYYRKRYIWTILSFIFVIFTFKRLSIVFAIALFFLPLFININKDAGNKLKILLKIAFVFFTILYYNLLLPDFSDTFYSIFNESQAKFTMGRSNFLYRIINNGYISSGFGSTTIFLGRSLEMDLIKILIELSIVGLMIFVWKYWNCAGNNLYTYIYMSFQFFNMLTSHSLSNSFNWILVFAIIGCISYKKQEEFSSCLRINVRKRENL